MKEIELKVTIDETNLILEALGNLPFARVYSLVAKVQAQAREQLDQTEPLEPGAETAKTPPEVAVAGREKTDAN
jgi:hypothetical protein